MGDVYSKVVDAGFDEFCTKPVDFKELSRLLVSYLDPDGVTDADSSGTPGARASPRKSGRSSASASVSASDSSRPRSGLGRGGGRA